MVRFVLLASVFALGACAVIPESEAPAAAAGSSVVLDAASAEARTRTALQRIEELNPRLNAVIAVDPTALDQARALDRQRRARGPLFGMPILIKDNIEMAGPLPTTAGSLALADNVTNRDAPLVARLRAAGAVIVGKSNLSEWANIRSNNSISGWSAVGGQVRNPHALNRNPCGSSSGSGAAVAAGMVPAAIGTETVGFTTSLRFVEGFRNLPWTLAFLVSVAISMALLELAARTIPMGTAYAVWGGIGAIGTVLVGMLWFGEPTTTLRMLLILGIVACIAGLKLTA